MTTRLTTPWWVHHEVGDGRRPVTGGVAPTRSLDWRSGPVRALVAELPADEPRRVLQHAHGLIAARVRPVYAVDDRQSASTTLSRGRGSCSQRLAILDAVARTAVDWDGETSTPDACSACDLSARVRHDLGRFDSRDELFDRHGQTLCWGVRTLAGPVLRRWSAGGTTAAAVATSGT